MSNSSSTSAAVSPVPPSQPDRSDVNVAVVSGLLSSDPVERVLRSGDRLMVFQVRTTGGERTTSVPVVWRDAPESASSLRAGDRVVAMGRIHRRFYGGAAGRQSATELVADRVVAERARRSVRSMVSRAVAQLDASNR